MEQTSVSLGRRVALLERELDEALEQQRATSEILRVISASPGDLGPVFDAIAEHGARLCEAEYCFVFRFDGELMHPVAYHGLSRTGIDAVRAIFPRGPDPGSAAGRAVVSGVVEQIPDVFDDPEYRMLSIARVVSYRSVIAVPLMRDGKPIGAIAVTRQEAGPFPERQVDLLKTFADQAVLAIENARLFEEAQSRNRDVTEAHELLRVISTSPTDVQPVFDTIAQRAASLCDARFCHVFRFDGQLLHFVASQRQEPDVVEAVRDMFPSPPDRGTAAGRSVLSRSVEQIADQFADPEYTAHGTLRGLLGDYRSLIAVPIMRDGNPIGTIVVARAAPGLFPPRQVELLRTFADQAGIAIENVRLFTDLEARNLELKESLQQQTATSDVLKVISRSTFDVQAVLDTLVESGVRLCEAHDAIIFLRSGDVLQLRAHRGPIPIDFPDGPVSRGWVTGRAVVDGMPVHVPDLTAMPDEYPEGQMMAVRLGHRTILAVPLLRHEEAIGALTIRRTENRPFTEKQIELVRTFADQAVIAIENVRLFEEVQARNREVTQALEQQKATSDILRVISTSPTDPRPVFETIARSVVSLCGSLFANVFQFDGELLHYVASHNVGPSYVEMLRSKYPMRPDVSQVSGRVIIAKSVVRLDDALADPEYDHRFPFAAKWRRMLGVPMLRRSELLGVIVVGWAEAGPIPKAQEELLKQFADQAVIAIENTRLFDEVQAKTRDLEEALAFQKGTSDVLEVIGRSASESRPVLDAIVDTAAGLCRAEAAAVRLVRDGALHHAAASGRNGGALASYSRQRSAVPMDRSTVAGRVALEGRTVHIHNIDADAEYTFLDGFDQRSAVGSALGVPLFLDRKVVGAIVLMRKSIDPFTERQMALIQTLADQAVIAMENVRLFREVQARTEDLSRSLEDLRTAQDRLIQTEKLASLGQLTAGIAHEIKNPLNFVNNFAALSIELMTELRQVLAGPEPKGASREAIDELAAMLEGNLDRIVQHGKRADSIVRNMLLHSRQGSAEHRPADINAIVEESLNLAYHGARAEKQGFNVTLEKSLDPVAGEVDLYPQEITRVLLNLISNGFYATSRRAASEAASGYEPVLAAATRSLGDSVEITIRDNGTGISPEVREKMFNPFFTTKPAGEGTGLGLSLSHDIVVKQHAGSIHVESEPGRYTEFRIRLPRNAAAAARVADRS